MTTGEGLTLDRVVTRSRALGRAAIPPAARINAMPAAKVRTANFECPATEPKFPCASALNADTPRAMTSPVGPSLCAEQLAHTHHPCSQAAGRRLSQDLRMGLFHCQLYDLRPQVPPRYMYTGNTHWQLEAARSSASGIQI